jgi:cyclopropane fatty-acyl-phospholipid synthase-like methyltransferase
MPNTLTTSGAKATADNLVSSYLRLFRDFRRNDLEQFLAEHSRLFDEAQQTEDYAAATSHYYGLMASVIATYYGEGWHFCPPEVNGQSRQAATHRMYRLVADRLQLEPGQHALDIGCGVGGMLRFLARDSGAKVTGITLGANEVEQAGDAIAAEDLDNLCTVIQGDSRQMPFDEATFDSAYAVYALKYYPNLSTVLSEIQRVLKPGGRFTAYCLCKSKAYRADDPVHAKVLRDFEFSTAMPPLHTVDEIIRSAEAAGLQCVEDTDISTSDLTWYSYWTRNPLLPWLVNSRLTYALARTGEAIRILPRGFARFNDAFLAGTLRHIIRGGRMGILTGSAMLTFRKPLSH